MKPLLPQRRTDVRVIEESGQTQLVTASGDRVCSLNESALAIWELCDGDTTADEMALAIAELCSIGQDQALADVDRTLSGLHAAGVIELGAGSPVGSRRDRSTTWSPSST